MKVEFFSLFVKIKFVYKERLKYLIGYVFENDYILV